MEIATGTQNFALGRESKQDWGGLKSNKWSNPERLHLRANDQLGDKIIGVDLPVLGRKHFSQPYSETYDYKPCLRLFPDRANRESQLGAFSFKKIAFVPPQRRYNQNDKFRGTVKIGLAGGRSMQGVARIQDPNSKTNIGEIRSMSNITSEVPGGSLSNLNTKKLRMSYDKSSWKEREDREAKHEDEKAVSDLANWERRILTSSAKQQPRNLSANSPQHNRGLSSKYSNKSTRR